VPGMTANGVLKKHIRMIAVDDEESILKLYQRILLSETLVLWNNITGREAEPEQINLDLTLCTDGAAALRLIAQNNTEPYAIIFIDVHLALGENGIELAEKIRVMDKDIQIVLITGDDRIDLADIRRRIPPGNKLFYLLKPFNALEICQFVASLSAQWNLEKQLKSMHYNLENMVVERTEELMSATHKLIEEVETRTQVEESLRQSLENIQIIIKGTIQVIAKLLAMKDPYTAGHQKRVSELAREIAAHMKLEEHDLEAINMAGLIHDIGKISIPSEILSKPGRLSELEFDLIKTHPHIGYSILKEIEFPWPIAQIVYQHHEYMDGSGYPRGLRGDEIGLLARILTVADVVEAIASDRPYRAALGIEQGIRHIEEMRGVYYDPEVVDVCKYLFKEKKFEFKTKVL
jgi:putative nucleotidyltransferase with HDIG domain